MSRLYCKRIICHLFSRAFFKMTKRAQLSEFVKKSKLAGRELIHAKLCFSTESGPNKKASPLIKAMQATINKNLS